MTKLRISIVKYLNTAPLVRGFTHGALSGRYDLSFTVPSQCAEALRTGAADVAIIPAIEYQRMEDVVALPGMAIASNNRARSLLVVSKAPIEQTQRMALDRSSRSTQALVRLLCAEQWKIAPDFFEAAPDLAAMLNAADAALVIGDPALRLSIQIEGRARRGISGEVICRPVDAGLRGVAAPTLYVYDVVEQWRRMTGLPAVLAFWAARREIATPEIVTDFLVSREYGVARIVEISEEGARELALPAESLAAYLRENIQYTLGAESRRGLDLFFARCAAHGLIPRDNPVEWAEADSNVLSTRTRT